MKSFILKSIVLVIIYLGAQYMYYNYTNTAILTTPLMRNVLVDADTHREAEIVSFGSSIEYMSHPKEKDRRTMTQRLQGYLPDRKIIPFSQAAFTIKLLEPFIKFYHKHIDKDQFYIIELNLDQFSLTDNKRFLDRTPERLSYGENLTSALYKPMSIFNYDYGVLTEKEFDQQEIYLDGQYIGQMDSLFNGEHLTAKELFKNRYMIQNMYTLDRSHVKIKSLMRLIDFLNKEQVENLFYITPFDYLGCEKYFDARLCQHVLNGNIKVLTDILEEHGINYINMSKDLDTKHIATTPLAPNGHLKGSGRDHVAKMISIWIKENLRGSNAN